MIILPAIDIKDGNCVRLFKGDFSTVEKVASDYLETAKGFEDAGAKWIHMVDLDGAKEGRPVNTKIYTDVAEKTNLKVELGGGIRSLETIDEYLKMGITRVILGSVALKNPKLVSDAVEKFGSEKIVVGIDAMNEMVEAYLDGSEVVYGVRSSRKTDTFFKRFTAQGFYKFMNLLGAEVVYNHADYRLISARVLKEFANFKEVNLFLRGMIPLVGFKSSSVYYERHERIAGESHYPLSKMLALAFNGITSLSIKPLRLITSLGLVVSILSFIATIWAIIAQLAGHTVTGWASLICVICFMGGIQLICLGVIGEYIGKIYMEVKARPRYIISERTEMMEEHSKISKTTLKNEEDHMQICER